MAKAEYGTPKFIAKQMKARGLQKTKFYCQICQKQCRDQNGFKAHVLSKSHTRNAQSVTPQTIAEYSGILEKDFLRLLRMAHGSKPVNVNKFYQEYIGSDRDHVHLNATRFTSLSSFVRYLVKEGKIEVVGDFVEGDMQNVIVKMKEEGNRGKEKERKERKERSEEEVRLALIRESISRAVPDDKQGEEEVPKETPKEAEEEAEAKTKEFRKIPIKLAMKKGTNKIQKVDLGFKRR